MHEGFYVSGFLYNLPTQQILLLQRLTTNSSSSWSLFEGVGLKGESSEITFQRVIYDLLHVKLPLEKIHPVYTYFNSDIDKNHAIVYAEIGALHPFKSTSIIRYAWFTSKQILKLDLAEQTKHDIIVGQRVIDSKIRKSLGLRTLEG